MIDMSMFSNPGGRENNEDYIRSATHGDDRCFILCDGLGGHECGEVASMTVAENVARLFEEKGDYTAFLDDAFTMAQNNLLKLQKERGMINAMKTTLVVLVVTDTIVKWAHIGDSRLYRFYGKGKKYQRTRDHSMVQILCDMGEITEKEMRHHDERNKLLRVMGSEWTSKSYDKSAVIERGEKQAFALMTDGFWEYVLEDEMIKLLGKTSGAKEWMDAMSALVFERADMTKTDNFSVICVRID